MKPTLRRKDVVEVQSRTYIKLPGGGHCSFAAGAQGTVIDFFPASFAVAGGYVDVEMVALVAFKQGKRDLIAQVNERALKLVKRPVRSRPR